MSSKALKINLIVSWMIQILENLSWGNNFRFPDMHKLFYQKNQHQTWHLRTVLCSFLHSSTKCTPDLQLKSILHVAEIADKEYR